jgi:uncharacterized protein (TIGR02284 family)
MPHGVLDALHGYGRLARLHRTAKGHAMSNDDIIDTLNDLIETCKDGEYGFHASAEYLKDPSIKQIFERRAEDCRQAAAELQAQVVQLGGKAEDSGTAAGAMHRGWVAVKGTLAGYTDKAILEETERGEDTAMSAYRKALEEALPPEVRTIVERQYEGVKRNHLQVRTLRDQARAAV